MTSSNSGAAVALAHVPFTAFVFTPMEGLPGEANDTFGLRQKTAAQ
jgi:hypothetical protein